jgi:Na+(H+)/acetate symporter ActP
MNGITFVFVFQALVVVVALVVTALCVRSIHLEDAERQQHPE